jgi:hypothetical protein
LDTLFFFYDYLLLGDLGIEGDWVRFLDGFFLVVLGIDDVSTIGVIGVGICIFIC